MYIPPQYAETDSQELHRLMREHPLGLLVTHGPDGLDANHLPFLLDVNTEGPAATAAATPGPGTLLAHVARANPLWQAALKAAEADPDGHGPAVLVVFRGPQGYISPNWYPSNHETHRRVPTWNYEAVHAHGRLRVHDDERFLRGLLARLTRRHEAAEPVPWKMGDAPADFIAEELRHIVGIEIQLTRLEGKRKLNQHHEARDRDGAIQALDERGRQDLALAMRRAGG